MFVLLASTIPRSFYLSEYENLTAVLVETKLQENYFFWGVTPTAKTAQLQMTAIIIVCYNKMMCQSDDTVTPGWHPHIKP